MKAKKQVLRGGGLQRHQGRQGFSLLEMMIAAAILGFCFLPILNHSRSTMKETEVSQEDLLARHFLIDLVERYKGSPVVELRRHPPTFIPKPLGAASEDEAIREDEILSDRARIVKEMQTKAVATGVADASLESMKRVVDLAEMMKITRAVVFQENVGGTPGVHMLTCFVRWNSKVGTGERSIQYSKILVRES